MTAPGYAYGFPMPTSGVMPPPGFQFPGAGFQAGLGPHPGCPASLDHQDYPEGVPHPSHSEKDPHAGEPNHDLTVDEAEDLIPIDSDSKDGSDCEIIEVMDSPSVTTLVKTSKAKQKPMDQVMKQAAAKVGAAHMDEILGAVFPPTVGTPIRRCPPPQLRIRKHTSPGRRSRARTPSAMRHHCQRRQRPRRDKKLHGRPRSKKRARCWPCREITQL